MQKVQATLKNASRPPLCHTVTWTGAVNEGITLELNHPATPMAPAFFVGETYIRRDNRRGCAYRINDDGKTAQVYRAMLREIPNDRYTLRFLCEPDGRGDHSHLLHVDLTLPQNIKPKRLFWTGTDGQVVEKSENEFLLELKAGATAHVFLATGNVLRLVGSEALVVEKLPLEQQANVRIGQMHALLEATANLKKNERDLQRNYLLHQLLTILEMVGSKSEPLHAGLARALRTIEKKGLFGPTVAKRFRRIMEPPKTAEIPETALGAAFLLALNKKKGVA